MTTQEFNALQIGQKVKSEGSKYVVVDVTFGKMTVGHTSVQSAKAYRKVGFSKIGRVNYHGVPSFYDCEDNASLYEVLK